MDERSDEWVVTGFSYASDSEPLLRALNVDILWGKENASGETQTTSAPWSLKGTIEEGDTRIAIVDVDKESREVKRDRYVRFNVGDTLPNGAKVTKIGKNQIEFEMNGETYVKKLYE
ncbi:hypothetical protein [Alteromonas flava]|uniref:hypothetical protein n=1 Tax=Alteromonas flava TaxID=2048003 RepID=UPI0013DC953E|nr:hypothetical protein [Alteromonas flava]